MPHTILSCLLFFTLLTGCFPAFSCSASAASPEASYEDTKKSMADLIKNDKRNRLREPWMDIIRRFDALYEKKPQWPNRVAALFRAGMAYGELSKRSFLAQDAKEGIERFERLAREHSSSPLADDALFEAARLHEWPLKSPTAAVQTLQRLVERFPKGDMVSKAQARLPELEAKARASTDANEVSAAPSSKDSSKSVSARARLQEKNNAAQNRITGVTWQSKRNYVRVIVALDRPTTWIATSQVADSKTGRPARLIVEMPGVTPNSDVKPGVRVSKSALTRVRLDLSSAGKTRLLLDFSEIRRFHVKQETSPPRLIIEAGKTDAALPYGRRLGSAMQSADYNKENTASTRVPSDLATQLGLSVRTVVIDPGHGGSDPGTEHNGISERDLVLDMSKRIGKELTKRGFKVIYTRTKNTRVELDERAHIANEGKGDIFLSIHVNAGLNADVHGFETYFLDFASSTAASRVAAVENAVGERKLGDMESLVADLMLGARTQESRRLAQNIQRQTISTVKKSKYSARDGGLRSAPFHVLLGAGMPGVLIELGYCTNKAEAKRLLQPAYGNALAKGIANGVQAYANRLEEAS